MNKHKNIKDANHFLWDHLDDIYTVTEWARTCGYSRAYFSTLIREKYHTTPYRIIKRQRFIKVSLLVELDPDRKGADIAQEAGFKDVKALYKFLKTHYQTTLTAMRKKEKTLRMWSKSNK